MNPKDTPANCQDCQRPLRPRGTPKKHHPGTLVHHAHGLCSKCYEKVRPNNERRPVGQREYERQLKGALLPERPKNLTGATLQLRRDIEQMILERRARGVPALGIPPEEWALTAAVAA